jgi:hypothetical protein
VKASEALPPRKAEVPEGRGGSEFEGERDEHGIPMWKTAENLTASEKARLIRRGHDPERFRR